MIRKIGRKELPAYLQTILDGDLSLQPHENPIFAQSRRRYLHTSACTAAFHYISVISPQCKHDAEPYKPPYSSISPTLPFLDGTQSGNAYTPAIDDEGNIIIYTGICGSTAQGSSLWQLTPSNEGSTINGTWKELDLTPGGIDGNTGLDGANYLASAIAFSSTANATSELYIFGGMCPNSTSLTADNWTQSANYSNTMLIIESAQSSLNTAPAYDLGISPSRGPPVAEAGFTITPPTYLLQFWKQQRNTIFESKLCPAWRPYSASVHQYVASRAILIARAKLEFLASGLASRRTKDGPSHKRQNDD